MKVYLVHAKILHRNRIAVLNLAIQTIFCIQSTLHTIRKLFYLKDPQKSYNYKYRTSKKLTNLYHNPPHDFHRICNCIHTGVDKIFEPPLFWLLGKFQLLYVKYEILKKINQPSDHTVSDASLRVEYRADIYLSLEYNLIKLENSSSWQLAIETTDIKVGTDAAVSIPAAKF